MDGGNDALEVHPFAWRNIEGTIFEDLDLETLKDAVILAGLLVPPVDALSLQSQSLGVETGGDFESA